MNQVQTRSPSQLTLNPAPPQILLDDLLRLGYVEEQFEEVLGDFILYYEELYEIYKDRVLPYDIVEYIIENSRDNHCDLFEELPLINTDISISEQNSEYIIYFHVWADIDDSWRNWVPRVIIGKKLAKEASP